MRTLLIPVAVLVIVAALVKVMLPWLSVFLGLGIVLVFTGLSVVMGLAVLYFFIRALAFIFSNAGTSNEDECLDPNSVQCAQMYGDELDAQIKRARNMFDI